LRVERTLGGGLLQDALCCTRSAGVVAGARVHLVPDVMLERVVVRVVGCERDDAGNAPPQNAVTALRHTCRDRQLFLPAGPANGSGPSGRRCRCPRLTASCCARRRAGRDEKQRSPQGRCTLCFLSRTVSEALGCALSS
jgi:hypothetical protein